MVKSGVRGNGLGPLAAKEPGDDEVDGSRGAPK